MSMLMLMSMKYESIFERDSQHFLSTELDFSEWKGLCEGRPIGLTD
jgi:hypothetical protein